MTSRSSQSGNVLFYILLCVGLFAALGYAFSRGGDSGAKAVSNDKTRLIATEIVSHGNQLREVVAKLKLRGCGDTQFDFTNSVYQKGDGAAAIPANTNSPPDNSCDIFASTGGGLSPYFPPLEATSEAVYGDTPKPGHGMVSAFQIKGIGSDGPTGTISANDIFFIIYYINQNVCLKINNLLGVANPSNLPPTDNFIGTTTSNYTNGSLVASGVATISGLKPGQHAFCMRNGAGYNVFIQTLIPR